MFNSIKVGYPLIDYYSLILILISYFNPIFIRIFPNCSLVWHLRFIYSLRLDIRRSKWREARKPRIKTKNYWIANYHLASPQCFDFYCYFSWLRIRSMFCLISIFTIRSSFIIWIIFEEYFMNSFKIFRIKIICWLFRHIFFQFFKTMLTPYYLLFFIIISFFFITISIFFTALYYFIISFSVLICPEEWQKQSFINTYIKWIL